MLCWNYRGQCGIIHLCQLLQNITSVFCCSFYERV